LLDKLTLSTGAPDEEARVGEKRDRVDYDALAEQLIAEAERLLADRDNASTEQLRSLSSRLYDLGDDHEQELTRRNYRAVQAALERVQAEELRRDAGATQAELDDLTDVEGESEDEGEEVMLPGSTQSPPAQADADDDGGLDRNALPPTQSQDQQDPSLAPADATEEDGDDDGGGGGGRRQRPGRTARRRR